MSLQFKCAAELPWTTGKAAPLSPIGNNEDDFLTSASSVGATSASRQPEIIVAKQHGPTTVLFVDIARPGRSNNNSGDDELGDREDVVLCTFSTMPQEGEISAVAVFNIGSASSAYAFVGTTRGWHILVSATTGEVLWLERRVSVTPVALIAVAPTTVAAVGGSGNSNSSARSQRSVAAPPALAVIHENGLCAVYLAAQLEAGTTKATSSGGSGSASDRHKFRFAISVYDRKRLHQLPPDDPEIKAFYRTHPVAYPRSVVNLGAPVPRAETGAKAACAVVAYTGDASLGVLRSHVLRVSLWIASAAVGVLGATLLVDDGSHDEERSNNGGDGDGSNFSSVSSAAAIIFGAGGGASSRSSTAHRVADAAMAMLAQRVFHSETLSDALAMSNRSAATSIDAYPLVPFSLCIPPAERRAAAMTTMMMNGATNSSCSSSTSLVATTTALGETICVAHFGSQGRVMILNGDVLTKTIKAMPEECVVMWVRCDASSPDSHSSHLSFSSSSGLVGLLLGVLHRRRQVMELYDVMCPVARDQRRVCAAKLRHLSRLSLNSFHVHQKPKQRQPDQKRKDESVAADSEQKAGSSSSSWSVLPRSSFPDGTGAVFCERGQSAMHLFIPVLSSVAASQEPLSTEREEAYSTSLESTQRPGRSTEPRREAPAGQRLVGRSRTPQAGARGQQQQQQNQSLKALSLTATAKEIEAAVRALMISAATATSSSGKKAWTLRDLVMKTVVDATSTPSSSPSPPPLGSLSSSSVNSLLAPQKLVLLDQLRTVIKSLVDSYVSANRSDSISNNKSHNAAAATCGAVDEEYFRIMSSPDTRFAHQVLVVLDALLLDPESAAMSAITAVSTSAVFSPTASVSSSTLSSLTTNEEEEGGAGGVPGDSQSALRKRQREEELAKLRPLQRLAQFCVGVVAGTQRGIGDPAQIAQIASSVEAAGGGGVSSSAEENDTAGNNSRTHQALKSLRDNTSLIERLLEEVSAVGGEEAKREETREIRCEQTTAEADGSWLLRAFSFGDNVRLALSEAASSCGRFSSSSATSAVLADAAQLGCVLFAHLPSVDVALKIVHSPPAVFLAAGIRSEEASFAFLAWFLSTLGDGDLSALLLRLVQSPQQQSTVSPLAATAAPATTTATTTTTPSSKRLESFFRRFLTVVDSCCSFPILRFLCLHAHPAQTTTRTPATATVSASALRWICMFRLAHKFDSAFRHVQSGSIAVHFDQQRGEADFIATFIRTVVALEAAVAGGAVFVVSAGSSAIGRLSALGGSQTAFSCFAVTAAESFDDGELQQQQPQQQRQQYERSASLSGPQQHLLSPVANAVSDSSAAAMTGLMTRVTALSACWAAATSFSVIPSRAAQAAKRSAATGTSSSQQPEEVDEFRCATQSASLSLQLLDAWTRRGTLEPDDPLLLDAGHSVLRILDAAAHRFLRSRAGRFIFLSADEQAADEARLPISEKQRLFEHRLGVVASLVASSAAVARAVWARLWPDIATTQGPELALTRSRDGSKCHDGRAIAALLDLAQRALEDLQSRLTTLSLLVLHSAVARENAEAMMLVGHAGATTSAGFFAGDPQEDESAKLEQLHPLISLAIVKFISSDVAMPLPAATPVLVRELSALAQCEHIMFLSLLPHPDAALAASAASASPTTSIETVSSLSARLGGRRYIDPTNINCSSSDGRADGAGQQLTERSLNSSGSGCDDFLQGVLQADRIVASPAATAAAHSGGYHAALRKGLENAISAACAIDSRHVTSSALAALRIIAALRVVMKYSSSFRNATGQPFTVAHLLLCDGDEDDVSDANERNKNKNESSSNTANRQNGGGDDDDDANDWKDRSIEAVLAEQHHNAPHIKIISRVCSSLLLRFDTMRQSDYSGLLEYDAAWRGGGGSISRSGGSAAGTKSSTELLAQSAHFVWANALSHALRRGQDELALQTLISRVNHKGVAACVVITELRFRLACVVDKLERATLSQENPAAQRAANDLLMSIPLELKNWCVQSSVFQALRMAESGGAGSAAAGGGVAVKKPLVTRQLLQCSAALATRIVELRSGSGSGLSSGGGGAGGSTNSAAANQQLKRAKALATTFGELLARFR